MKLYPRKLHSVAELRKERQTLHRQSKDTDNEDMFAFGAAAAGKKKAAKAKAPAQENKDADNSKNNIGDYISAFSGIMGARSVVDGAMSAAPLLLRFLPNARVKRAMGIVVKEFAGGYLKWKAIEIGFRMAKRYMLLRRQKRKHEKQKQH